MTPGLDNCGRRGGFHLQTWALVLGFLFALASAAEAAAQPAPHAVVELQLRKSAMRIPTAYQSFLKDGRLWQGEARLHGQKWLLGVLQQSDVAPATPRISWILLQSAAVDGSTETNRSWIFSPATGLSLNGHSYRVDSAFEGTGPAARWRMIFHEEQPFLGELKIEGQDIQRLQLHGDRIVLVEHPGTTVRLPAGKYSLTQVTVGKSHNAPWFVSSLYQVTEVNTNKTNMLQMGGPLTNRVAVTRQGRTMLLDYELLGAQGHAYKPDDLSRPPRFKVSRAGRTVRAGTFEFG